ncbi:hypothetical protein G7Y89_g12046 [Cudoniella acicularis]|uniref:Uncharacterized protein n=1 Tax=Cudoniella acicularis TaxID=354080 RepID=A0A8H4R9U7_9HELO|nr:hypothetical protein G7Y89_g12046 [Cudoniella acicularis]
MSHPSLISIDPVAITDVKVLGCMIELASADQPFGKVKHGMLALEARTLPLSDLGDKIRPNVNPSWKRALAIMPEAVDGIALDFPQQGMPEGELKALVLGLTFSNVGEHCLSLLVLHGLEGGTYERVGHAVMHTSEALQTTEKILARAKREYMAPATSQIVPEGNLERHENTTGACVQYMYKSSLVKNVSENRLKNEERDSENQFRNLNKLDDRACFDTIVIRWVKYHIYSPKGCIAFPFAKARTFYGVEDERHWRCQVTDCVFMVTKPTKKFDLHLTSKHIDGGLRWYCGDLKCEGRSWYGMAKKSIRKHVETIHSGNVEEAWKKCALLHPTNLDDHFQSRKDLKSLQLPFDSIPWIHKTQEPVHPELIGDISSMVMLMFDNQEQFKCYYVYTRISPWSARSDVAPALTIFYKSEIISIKFIVDTIIDYGLTVAELFAQYSTPKVFDRRFYTLVKMLDHPSNKRILRLKVTPTEIVQALRQVGMNEDSILIDWSMCRFDWKMNMPGLCLGLDALRGNGDFGPCARTQCAREHPSISEAAQPALDI